MVDSLLDLASSSPWAYAAILAIAALDVILPLLPSEATLISAGVLAGSGDLSLVLVIGAGTAGALLGDTSAYSAGRLLGPRIERRLFGGAKATRRRDWAARALGSRGGLVIFGARFLPGGRTAATVSAGVLGMTSRRFLRLAGAAGVVWASSTVLFGFLGGRALERHPLPFLALVVASGVAAVVAIESIRRLRRRGWSSTGDAADATAPAAT